MNRLLAITLLGFAALLGGCASTMHGPQFVQQPTQTTTATLYVFRLETPPYSRKPDIRINGVVVAELPIKSYFAVSLRPGKYEIKSDYGPLDNLILSKSTTLTVMAGSSYFVEFTGKPGIYGTAVSYGAGIVAGESLVAPEGIKSCTLVKANAEQVLPL